MDLKHTHGQTHPATAFRYWSRDGVVKKLTKMKDRNAELRQKVNSIKYSKELLDALKGCHELLKRVGMGHSTEAQNAAKVINLVKH